MSSFISQQSIDEISQRADIVSIIDSYVPLTRKGADYWGLCPFHNDRKKPSFSVSSIKKFYYCFTCQAKGTIFNFIMNMEGCSFPEAIEILAKKTGVQLVYENGGKPEYKKDESIEVKKQNIELYNRLSVSFNYFLLETEAGKFALDYITERGLSIETLKKFRLGYSPRDGYWLHKFLKSKNYSDEFLEKTGLFTEKNKKWAFFVDRLMFPIFDANGSVVAMGGRFLRGNPENSAKYLNSKDLPWYKKGTMLYGYNLAKKAIRENRKIILCEGYMDCIAYHQCGIEYAVAPLGTALTADQIKLFKSYVDYVLLSFDSDDAGQKATMRSIYLLREHDIEVRIIQLQGGKDPAEIMLNFGPQNLTNDVNGAILDDDFIISKLQILYPKGSPEGKRKASIEFFKYLDCLQMDIQKEACMEKFCQAYDILPDVARRDYINKKNGRKSFENERTEQPLPEKPKEFKVTGELLAVLTAVTEDSSLFQRMRQEISVDDLEDTYAKELYILLEDSLNSGNFSISTILTRCAIPELQNLIIKSTVQDSGQSSEENKKNELKALDSTLMVLKRNVLQRKSIELQDHIRRFENSTLAEDKKLMNELIIQKMKLTTEIAQLKKRINNGKDL